MAKSSVTAHAPQRDGPAPSAITQAMLAEYVAADELWRVREERRTRLITLLEAGSEVEPGPLTARIDYSDRTILSRGQLIRVLGEAEVERLTVAVGPTRCRYLRVTTRAGGR